MYLSRDIKPVSELYGQKFCLYVGVYTVRTAISAPPLQNAVSHTTAERMQLLLCRSPIARVWLRNFAAMARLWLYALYIYIYMHNTIGARGNIVVKVLCYKPEGRGFETLWGEWISALYVILTAALGPWVHPASNRNEYQKQKNNVSGK
jgi:hypothetical protein